MGDELEERLRSHARAFEGLMSLIPAKQYYGEDTSDQWQRKKQTKEQKRAAKRAKLDPANNKSAKDVLDENERKRKRELGMDEQDDDAGDLDLPGREKPREGLKPKGSPNKKQKTAADGAEGEQPLSASQDDSAERQRLKIERRKEKELRKKEKAARRKAKAEDKQERKRAAKAADEEAPNGASALASAKPDSNDGDNSGQEMTAHSDLGKIDISGLEAEHDHAQDSSAPSSPARDSPPSVASAQPSTSSASSIVPPSGVEVESHKPDKIELPKIDKEELKARLEAKIAAMRAARHADGPDGKPARNRQELLEARRKKEEQRKAHKKEQRKQEKEDEMKAKAEAELARLRGSGSPLTTPDVFSPRSPPDANNFSFGRVFFKDGQTMDPSLSHLVDHKKRKGPSDPRTALAAAQKNAARVAGFDAEKRADIEEKDAWLGAKKKAHGERPRDDLSLLKKTLKRKQKAKMRSEKEWNDRIDGVKKGKEARQRKREDNLRKRRDEKGKKGKATKGAKATKKQGRPGFEGSIRGK